ncbi:MAG: FG-GAP-like repeat-containing protein, partial [bacterium]
AIAADLDGDGAHEILIPRTGPINALEVWSSGQLPSASSSSFVRVQNLSGGTNLHWIASGDVDGDGDEDQVVAASGSSTVQVWGHESGSLVADHLLAGVEGAVCVLLADLDGDGKVEIISSNHLANAFSVHFNQSIFDCNGNGIDDPLDVNSGFAQDC